VKISLKLNLRNYVVSVADHDSFYQQKSKSPKALSIIKLNFMFLIIFVRITLRYMKRSLASVILFASVIAALCLSSGCTKVSAPVTCYNAIPDTAYVGQSLNFSSCTTGANSYYWSFGDGSFATTATASHTYTRPGIDTGTFYTADGPGSHKNFIIHVLRPYNVWTFKGTSDTSLNAQAVSDTIQATNFSSTNIAHVSAITFSFSALPSASGSYQIVNDLSIPPGANQVAIYLTTPSGFNYGSTGHDNATASVTIAGGKVLISVPSAMMVNTTNPSDSAALSATIRQTE
jgi:hypothetical protein